MSYEQRKILYRMLYTLCKEAGWVYIEGSQAKSVEADVLLCKGCEMIFVNGQYTETMFVSFKINPSKFDDGSKDFILDWTGFETDDVIELIERMTSRS